MTWESGDITLAAKSVKFFLEERVLVREGYYRNVSSPVALFRDTKADTNGLVAWNFFNPEAKDRNFSLCHHYPPGFASGYQASGLCLIIPPVFSSGVSGYLDHVDYENCIAWFTQDPEQATGSVPSATYSYKLFGFADKPPDGPEDIVPPHFALIFDTEMNDDLSIPDEDHVRIVERSKAFMLDVYLRNDTELTDMLSIMSKWLKKNTTTHAQHLYIDFNQALPLLENGDRNPSFDPEAQSKSHLDFRNVTPRNVSLPGAPKVEKFRARVQFELIGHYTG